MPNLSQSYWLLVIWHCHQRMMKNVVSFVFSLVEILICYVVDHHHADCRYEISHEFTLMSRRWGRSLYPPRDCYPSTQYPIYPIQHIFSSSCFPLKNQVKLGPSLHFQSGIKADLGCQSVMAYYNWESRTIIWNSSTKSGQLLGNKWDSYRGTCTQKIQYVNMNMDSRPRQIILE